MYDSGTAGSKDKPRPMLKKTIEVGSTDELFWRLDKVVGEREDTRELERPVGLVANHAMVYGF